jgi:hypothetical protein
LAPPYNPEWGELCPCSSDQFLSTATKAGVKNLTMKTSETEPSVVYFERKLETGQVLTAVLSPDISSEREVTIRYLCGRLGIDVTVFKLTPAPNPSTPLASGTPPPSPSC